jgi:hypothetical protein
VPQGALAADRRVGALELIDLDEGGADALVSERVVERPRDRALA